MVNQICLKQFYACVLEQKRLKNFSFSVGSPFNFDMRLKGESYFSESALVGYIDWNLTANNDYSDLDEFHFADFEGKFAAYGHELCYGEIQQKCTMRQKHTINHVFSDGVSVDIMRSDLHDSLYVDIHYHNTIEIHDMMFLCAWWSFYFGNLCSIVDVNNLHISYIIDEVYVDDDNVMSHNMEDIQFKRLVAFGGLVIDKEFDYVNENTMWARMVEAQKDTSKVFA